MVANQVIFFFVTNIRLRYRWSDMFFLLLRFRCFALSYIGILYTTPIVLFSVASLHGDRVLLVARSVGF